MPSGVVVERFGALELVVPGRQGTPIDGFLARRGAGLHHLGVAVDQALEELVPVLAAQGIETVGGIEPGSDGRRTLFLHPRTTGGVLVELIEARR
jgi:methylmalonyl-CoA/ethylmalonyl-CoA epimerase